MSAALLARLDDWPQRLARVIDERYDAPFAWGTHDCVAFVRECVYAMTDHWLPLPGGDPAPTRAHVAMRRVRNAGGLRAFGRLLLGDEMDCSHVRGGDVALVRSVDASDVLAVLWSGRWYAPGQRGLCAVSFASALCAWRVG